MAELHPISRGMAARIRDFTDWVAENKQHRIDLRSLLDEFVYASNNRLAVHETGHVKYFRRDIKSLPDGWVWHRQDVTNARHAPSNQTKADYK